MAAAKGVTTTQTTAPNPSVVKPPEPRGGILIDDTGYPDLSKMQLIAWTLLAVGIFVTEVVHELANGEINESLPDIDPALVVLMGLGQAAYVGKKLVTTTTPILNGVSPPSGQGNTPVSVTGTGFGAMQGGSQVLVDNKPIAVTVQSWADTTIQFQIPATAPDGSPWVTGTVIRISLIVQGQPSANTVPYTLT